MKRRLRLKRQHDFQRLLTGPRLFSGIALVVFAAPAERPRGRVGVTVSKRIRGAPARNRARRRLREAARLSLLAQDSKLARAGINADIVLIARPAALEVPFDGLLAELDRAVSRLARS